MAPVAWDGLETRPGRQVGRTAATPHGTFTIVADFPAAD